MNKQEYYDLLVKTSLEGGFPAIERSSNSCKYRSSNGKKCAVGIIIPDNVYEKRFEGRSINQILKHYCFDQSWIPDGIRISDLKNIQILHDCNTDNWNHNYFIRCLNSLPCFSEIQKCCI